jgi:hypothetical protein
MNRRCLISTQWFIQCWKKFRFHTDPHTTALTHLKWRPSVHPVRWFTAEQIWSDGSTDAHIFPPSVHPMLHWRVGPICHNGLAPRPPHSNPNTDAVQGCPCAAVHAVSDLLRARGHTPPPPPPLLDRRLPPTSLLRTDFSRACLSPRVRVSAASTDSG